MPELTEEQHLAVHVDHQRILVSASAGTGKTHVLTQRYLRLVLREGIEVRQILAVTFTEAAAAEMRARIAQTLRGQLSSSSASAPADWLRRQLLLLERAPISTLHSFCLRTVREFFYLLELDPDFRVLDPAEAEVLKRDALEETLDNWFEQRPPGIDEAAFYRLVDEYGGLLAGEGLPQLLLELQAFLDTLPDPRQWWEEVLTLYECSAPREAMTPNLRAFWESVSPDRWPTAESELRQLAPVIRVLRALLEDFLRRYQRSKLERAWLDFADLERLTQQLLGREQVLAQLQRRYRHILVDEYQDINPLQNAILESLAGYDSNAPRPLFMVGDDKQSIYGFRLACPALFQEKLLRYELSRPAAPLGAIPSGTAARPDLKSAEGECPASIESASGTMGRVKPNKVADSKSARADGVCIPLTANFRSRRTLIEAVNTIFARINQLGSFGMRYDDSAHLVFGASYYEAQGNDSREEEPVGLYVLPDADPEADPDCADRQSSAAAPLARWQRLAREAELAARLIQQWVGQRPVWDATQNKFRPAQYADVVILMRTVQGRAQYVVETLRHQGIPVHAELRRGFWEALEIRDMTSLLQLLRNPLDDVPLAAVLHSPLVGLDVAELASVRLARRDGPFYWALHQYLQHTDADTALAEKIRNFLDHLQSWRTRARRYSIARVLWDIYRETGYFAYVQALPDGTARAANLILLHDIARQFERNLGGDLERFLHYLERLREYDQDFGPANVVSPAENVVRLMSIHQSKGLEFPLVIVLDLGTQFNEESLRRHFLFHRDGLLGARIQDEQGIYRWPTELYQYLQKRLRLDFLAEELRLLYVAMTRARESLALIGTHNPWTQPRNIKKVTNSEQIPSPDQVHSALQWLVPVFRWARSHDVRVLRLYDIPTRDLGTVIGPASAPETGSATNTLARGHDDMESRVVSASVSSLDVPEPAPTELELVKRELLKRLHWQYPHQLATRWPGKTSPTRLRLWLEQDDDTAPWLRGSLQRSLSQRPRFVCASSSSTTLSASSQSNDRHLAATCAPSAEERGLLTHRFLRYVHLRPRVDDEKELRRQLTALVKQGLFTDEEASAVDLAAVAAFFRRPLGQRIRRARQVHRELAFSMMVPANDLPSMVEHLTAELSALVREQLNTEQVLVQGAMDLLFWEKHSDGPILVDFKTDALTCEELNNAQHRYAPQLAVYARAVQQALGQTCREVWLAFLTVRQDILLDLEMLATCLRPSRASS
ncbi:MAG: UvrD-helicase domain-containing protein [Gemmatales bacterium]|nr:UvrD-helicase domain-containing protein [Gemmatales bacterium]MDW8223434.1 UvrD-helicase domain-containing protein [Gemmatales bacterium]